MWFLKHDFRVELSSFWGDTRGSVALPGHHEVAAGLIEVEPGSGRIAGATLLERFGIAMLSLGVAVTRPIGNVGFSVGARVVARILPSRKAMRIALAPDAMIEMPYADGYWSVLLSRRTRYEVDVEVAMRAFAGIDYAFIDCGANYGYWSTLVSSEGFGRHRAIAIEAAPDTYVWLERNAAANGARFAVLNRAVAEHSGDIVTISGSKHEARSIVPAAGAPVVGRVETLGLDDLLERNELAEARRIVLKLDVEGVEVPALKGATRLLERDVLIVYEDHGSDAAHTVSAHLIGVLGMRAFFIDAAGATEITTLPQITELKRNRHRGYDFFATRSSFWLGELDRLVAARRAGAAAARA